MTIRILFFLLTAVVSGAQTPESSVNLADTQQHTLTSAKIGQRYELLVSLPADYAKSGESYPVLYVLDGWHFPLMVFIQNNNVHSKRMRPVIIVNVSHGTTDYRALRARDFTPTRTAREANSGGAAAFLDFLEQELIPFVDRTWRTMPTDRALLGHSYGGLFAIFALEQRPALFQRIIAASPSLEWDGRLLLTAARDRLRKLSAPVRLDLSVGDEGDSINSTKAFAKILKELKAAGLDYRFTVYRGENHNSVRLVSFPAGLYWAYRPAK